MCIHGMRFENVDDGDAPIFLSRQCLLIVCYCGREIWEEEKVGGSPFAL